MDNVYYRLGVAEANKAQLEKQLEKYKEALEDMNIILDAITVSTNEEFIMVSNSVIPLVKKYKAMKRYI